MPDSRRVLSAREIMTSSLITLRADTSIFEAIRTLISKQISGAPVVDQEGKIVGVLSELDCLRVLSSDEFHESHQHGAGLVKDFMTRAEQTIAPDTGIYAIAHYFLTKPVRRLPVVEDGRLLGQVSRRDVLQGIQDMSRERLPHKRYPDYREPEKTPRPSGDRR